jgi:hypothetical protein
MSIFKVKYTTTIITKEKRFNLKNTEMRKFAILLILICISSLAISQIPEPQVNTDKLTKFQILTLTFSTISTILICIGFYFTNTSLKRNHDWNRRSKSIDALSPSSDRGRIEDLTILNEAFNYSQSNEPILLSTIDAKTKENPKILQILLARLNIQELYALGIYQGIYDEEFLKLSIGSSMKKSFFRFQNFIIKHREFSNRYCEALESIVLKWESEKQNMPKRKATA